MSFMYKRSYYIIKCVKDIYNDVAKELVKKFKENYNKYDMGDDSILKGGPL